MSPWFFVASDSSMCPGVDSALKNEYLVKPGGKGARCVRLTTYHLHVQMSRNLGALISWNPVVLFRPVMGQLLPNVQEAGWAPGPVWTGAESIASTGFRSPDRPARSESLY
jgi:hypothetical protein